MLKLICQTKPVSVKPSETCPICLEDGEEVPLCENLGDVVDATGARQGHGVCTSCLPDFLRSRPNSCSICRTPYGKRFHDVCKARGIPQNEPSGDVTMTDRPDSIMHVESNHRFIPSNAYAAGTVVWSLNEEDYFHSEFLLPNDARALTLGRGTIAPPGPVTIQGTLAPLYRINFDVIIGRSEPLRSAADFAPETSVLSPDPVDMYVGTFFMEVMIDGMLHSASIMRRIPVATPTAYYLVSVHKYHLHSFIKFMLVKSENIQNGLYYGHISNPH